MAVRVILADEFMPRIKAISAYKQIETVEHVGKKKVKKKLQREKTKRELLNDIIDALEHSIGEVDEPDDCECKGGQCPCQ